MAIDLAGVLEVCRFESAVCLRPLEEGAVGAHKQTFLILDQGVISPLTGPIVARSDGDMDYCWYCNQLTKHRLPITDRFGFVLSIESVCVFCGELRGAGISAAAMMDHVRKFLEHLALEIGDDSVANHTARVVADRSNIVSRVRAHRVRRRRLIETLLKDHPTRNWPVLPVPNEWFLGYPGVSAPMNVGAWGITDSEMGVRSRQARRLTRDIDALVQALRKRSHYKAA